MNQPTHFPSDASHIVSFEGTKSGVANPASNVWQTILDSREVIDLQPVGAQIEIPTLLRTPGEAVDTNKALTTIDGVLPRRSRAKALVLSRSWRPYPTPVERNNKGKVSKVEC